MLRPSPSTTRQQLPRQPAAASGRDARVLGSPPLRTLGSLVPLPLVQYPRWFERTSFRGSMEAFSSGCQPGVRVVPFLVWSVLGSPLFFLAEVTLFQRGTANEKTLD